MRVKKSIRSGLHFCRRLFTSSSIIDVRSGFVLKTTNKSPKKCQHLSSVNQFVMVFRYIFLKLCFWRHVSCHDYLVIGVILSSRTCDRGRCESNPEKIVIVPITFWKTYSLMRFKRWRHHRTLFHSNEATF